MEIPHRYEALRNICQRFRSRSETLCENTRYVTGWETEENDVTGLITLLIRYFLHKSFSRHDLRVPRDIKSESISEDARE